MKKNHKLFLTLILGLGLFLRLLRLESLFHFTMDEALIAFRGWGLFELNRPFLIGGISPLQIHLPPYFYYLSAFILKLSSFNPLGWGVSAALIAGLTIISLFYLTKKLTNKTTALIATFLYTFSFTAIFFDRHFWPLSLNPLFTVLSLFLLTKLNKKIFWPYLGLAAILVMALTSDPSNLPLALTIIIFTLINRKKLQPKFLAVQYSLATFTFILPLVLFDLRHHWQNLSGVSRLFTTITNRQFHLTNFINSLLLLPRSLARFWYSPQTNLTQLYSYCIPHASARQQALPIILVILASSLLIYFILKAKKPIYKAISLLLIFYLLGITLFGSLGFSIFDHYLAGLLPIFALITAFILTKLKQPTYLFILFLFAFINLWQFSQAHHPYSLSHKQDLITWANQQLQDQAYALDSISKCHKENGLRYLFAISGNPPTISFMDSNFAWLYRQPPAETMPDKILLVTDKPLETPLPIINQQIFGAMSAYILDNSEHLYEI